MPERTGVVVMAYGTPASPDDVEAYYTHIRRGRPPTPEQLADLTRRYDAIGGISPLARRTRAQIDAVGAALNDTPGPGDRFVLELGQKHAAPFVEDGVAALATAGVDRVVGLVLAPHYSGFSVGQYHERAQAAADEAGLPYARIDHWHLEPAFVTHQAASVRARLAQLPERTKVVFTAHSLPERVLVDDPYPDELHASAEAIAEQAGVARWAGWGLGWQSAGRTPEPWRGPDILAIIRDLAGTGRADGILVVPHGFTSDHLEVLYDLDVAAAAVAAEVGLAFARTDVVNDDHAVMAALADRVRARGPMTRLVVVGGGITGLAAAWEATTEHDDVEVVVLEAGDRLGGKIHTSDLDLPGGPLTVDEGADAFLTHVPDAVQLCQELGLTDQLVHPAVGRAKVFVGGELRPFPADQVLGIPLDIDGLAETGILSPDGLRAAAAELDSEAPPPDGDVAIGPFLAARYGRELVEHLVGPLIGGINTGDVEQLSLAAVTPQLADAAADGGSLIRALLRRRAAAPPPGPVFATLPGGTGALVDELGARCRARGVTIHLGATVTATHHGPDGHAATAVTVRHDDGRTDELLADALVLATPAPTAAALARALSVEAADELDRIEHCAVALVTFAYGREGIGVPLDGSGFLVPRDAGLLLTAASWGSTKWAHWDDGRHVILRVSAGHAGDDRGATLSDDELVAGLRSDLRTTMGLDAEPVVTRIARWRHGFAQYTVGHLARADRIDEALRRDAGTVRVTGAAIRGVGIPACIRQGRTAVRDLLGLT